MHWVPCEVAEPSEPRKCPEGETPTVGDRCRGEQVRRPQDHTTPVHGRVGDGRSVSLDVPGPNRSLDGWTGA